MGEYRVLVDALAADKPMSVACQLRVLMARIHAFFIYLVSVVVVFRALACVLFPLKSQRGQATSGARGGLGINQQRHLDPAGVRAPAGGPAGAAAGERATPGGAACAAPRPPPQSSNQQPRPVLRASLRVWGYWRRSGVGESARQEPTEGRGAPARRHVSIAPRRAARQLSRRVRAPPLNGKRRR